MSGGSSAPGRTSPVGARQDLLYEGAVDAVPELYLPNGEGCEPSVLQVHAVVRNGTLVQTKL